LYCQRFLTSWVSAAVSCLEANFYYRDKGNAIVKLMVQHTKEFLPNRFSSTSNNNNKNGQMENVSKLCSQVESGMGKID
jgi:hypothetical protein